MRVQCVICDTQQTIEDESPLAKKLRNRPFHTYLCEDCNERIRIKTEKRHLSGNFRLFHHRIKPDDF